MVEPQIKATSDELTYFFEYLEAADYEGWRADLMLSFALECGWRTVQRARLGETKAKGLMDRVRAALATEGVVAEALFQADQGENPAVAYAIAVLRTVARREGWREDMSWRNLEG